MDLSGKSYKAFVERQEALKKQYSPEQAQKQHVKGKLSAWERIRLLFDNGTFEEIDAFVTPASTPIEFGKIDRKYGDGVIVGHGKINGRLVFAYAQDFTIMGGSLGLVHSRKITKVQEMALKMGAPIIGMLDSGGARIQEGVASLSGYASIFHNIIQSSGIIPQISVIMGPCAGGAVYSPALTDFVFMVNHKNEIGKSR
jgi:acetyl-CoA carboxylase carboxyltransferase component